MAAAKKAAPKPGPGEDGYEPATAALYEGKTKVKSIAQLEGADAVAARVGPDARSDGRFRAEFTLSPRGYDENADNTEMHRANQVATLQRALDRGVHPRGEAKLDGHRTLGDGSVVLTYSVEAIPANEDDDPAGTYTPSKALDDMGGSTIDAANAYRADAEKK